MLERITVRGFKSLRDVTVQLPRLTLLFGANAAGKSNFLDALQFLSASVTQRSLQEALGPPIRGRTVEAFTLPPGGIEGLFALERAEFSIDAMIRPREDLSGPLNYRLRVALDPTTGQLSVTDEYLARLGKGGSPKGLPRIELDPESQRFRVRKKREVGRAPEEPVGENHTVASIPAYSGENFPEIEALRTEVSGWRTYYLEPRDAMRQAMAPAEVEDIGQAGELLPAFLYRLKTSESYRPHFDAIVRMVRQVVPTVQGIDVDLNTKRGEIELLVDQVGIKYSSRVVSEGTLRVLALAALALNPWASRLISFEEPENGVQPQRLEHIIGILAYAAGVGDNEVRSQLVVNTHSPIVVAQCLRLHREHPGEVSVLHVSADESGSRFTTLRDPGQLFENQHIDELLRDDDEARVQALLMRGLLDG